MQFFPATSQEQVRLYLDESGTLGFGDEVFTMAMVRVYDLPKLEACIARNKTTQAEIKASQMKTTQKLALAKTILDQNGLQIYLLTIDPAAASACERKLDKELLYDSMIAQAMAYYLERDELPQGLPYRLSLDMRGGIRESFEDMVCESIGNVLMHRATPLVSGLDIRYMDSKYSAGVQVADLFSNIYRTALAQKDSPCNGFLNKYRSDGIVHVGFAFGLPELAAQMTQIATDLRARVEYDMANNVASTFRTLPTGAEAATQETAEASSTASTGENANEAGGVKQAAPETSAANQTLSAADAQEGAGLRDEQTIIGSGFPAQPASEEDPTRQASQANGQAEPQEGMASLDEQDTPAEAPRALSRSARRRRSRAARKAGEGAVASDDQAANSQVATAVEDAQGKSVSTEQAPAEDAAQETDEAPVAKPRRRGRKPKDQASDDGTPQEKAAETTPEVQPAQAESADGPAPATEAVAHTARERRQKAARKTGRGAKKDAEGKPAQEAATTAEQEAAAEPVTTSDPAAAPAGADSAAQETAAQEKPKRTRTRGRKPKAQATENETAPVATVDTEGPAGMPTDVPAAQSGSPEGMATPEGGLAPTKPRTRRTRTRKAATKAAEAPEPSTTPEPAA